MANNKEQKPLTLDALTSYNQDVLFPWLKENLVVKKEFNGFKNRTLTSQDKILKKLDILLTEKTSRNYQEKKEKKFWAIIVKALQEHRILSSGDLQEISRNELSYSSTRNLYCELVNSGAEMIFYRTLVHCRVVHTSEVLRRKLIRFGKEGGD